MHRGGFCKQKRRVLLLTMEYLNAEMVWCPGMSFKA